MKVFRTLDLAVEFCDLIKPEKFPPHLRDQILRASSSVAMNLAEGNGKHSMRDKSRIYQIAMGSLRECQTAFRLAKIEDSKLLDVSDRLGASLYKLIAGVSRDAN